jgi:hypothetical protein
MGRRSMSGVCTFWSNSEVSVDRASTSHRAGIAVRLTALSEAEGSALSVSKGSPRPLAGEGGIPHAEWVRDSQILREENNPSPPASPYPLPSERAVINCGPAVNAKCRNSRHGPKAPVKPLGMNAPDS